MSTTAQRRFPGALPGPWLAARLGVDPARIDLMRRAGELIAVREHGSGEWLYPAWQLERGRPRPEIARITAAAQEGGIDEARLYELLEAPLGLGGSNRRRLVDLVREGRVDEVVDAVRAAA